MKLNLVLILTLLLPQTPIAVSAAPETAPLTLESFVSALKKNDPNYELLLSDRLRVRFNRELNLPTRGFLLTARDQYGLTSEEGGQTTHRFEAGLAKAFIDTGTTLSGNFTLNEQVDRNEKTTTLLVEQDVWRNAFGSQTRLQMSALERENEVIRLQVAEAYEDYLAEQIQNYLDLRLAYLTVEAAEALYRDSQALLKNLQKRQQSQVANQIDVDRIALQSLARQQELFAAEVTLAELSQALAAKIKWPSSVSALRPSSEIHYEKQVVDFALGQKYLISDSRSAEIEKLQIAASSLYVDYNERFLSPEVELLAGFQYDDSERFSETVDRSESLVGINLSFPFGDTRSEALVARAQLVENQTQLSYQLFLQRARAQAEGLRAKIEQQRKLVNLLEQKVALATRVAEQMQNRYQIGREDMDSLISAQNERASTQFAFLAAKIQLGQQTVQWLNLTDRLVLPEDFDAL